MKKSNHSIASMNSNQGGILTQQHVLNKHQQSLNSSVVSNQTKQYLSATKQMRSNQK